MPSMVREVSAMLVASTTLRAPGGVTSKILDCTASHNECMHAATLKGFQALITLSSSTFPVCLWPRLNTDESRKPYSPEYFDQTEL